MSYVIKNSQIQISSIKSAYINNFDVLMVTTINTNLLIS
jgi:hypothetical protein